MLHLSKSLGRERMATAVKPLCKRKSTNLSASSSSSTLTSEVTQEASNRPLLQADIYDEALLEQFDDLGSSGNEGKSSARVPKG